MTRDEYLGDYNLRQIAGKETFKRGVAYAKAGRVRITAVGLDSVVAQVQGTERYRIELSWRARRVDYSCDCYMGEQGFFCKHCVAAAIIWRDRDPADGDPYSDLRQFLRGLPAERLADMLIERAQQDEDLERRMLLQAAISGDNPDLDRLRRVVDEAVDLAQRAHWREMPGVAAQLHEVLAVLDDMLKAGREKPVRELCEHAVARIGAAMEGLDDSNGEFAHACARFFELHFEACCKLKPDVKQLARQVLDWMLADDYGFFEDIKERYFELLGAKGRKEVERLVEKAHADGTDDYALKQLRVRFARERGDVDAEVAILAENLTHPFAYTEIARTLNRAKREAEALEWLDRGMNEHPDDFPIKEAATEAYARAGRHSDALRIVWATFENAPQMRFFERLMGIAQAALEPDRWRDKAIGLLRKRMARAGSPEDWTVTGLRTLLVEIFLAEKNFEMAIAEADTGPISQHVLMQLAEMSADTHPERSKGFFERQLDLALKGAGHSAYEQVRDLLLKLRPIMEKLGQGAEFRQLLESIRTEYKRRPNLISELSSIK